MTAPCCLNGQFHFDLTKGRSCRTLCPDAFPIDSDRFHRKGRQFLRGQACYENGRRFGNVGAVSIRIAFDQNRLRSPANTYGTFVWFLNTSLPQNNAIGAAPNIVAQPSRYDSDATVRYLEYPMIARGADVAPASFSNVLIPSRTLSGDFQLTRSPLVCNTLNAAK